MPSSRWFRTGSDARDRAHLLEDLLEKGKRLARVSAVVERGRLLELAPLQLESSKHVEVLLDEPELARDARAVCLPRALVVLHCMHQLLMAYVALLEPHLVAGALGLVRLLLELQRSLLVEHRRRLHLLMQLLLVHRQLTKHRVELRDVEADILIATPAADAADAADATAAADDAAADSGAHGTVIGPTHASAASADAATHAAICGRAAADADTTVDAAANAAVDPARLPSTTARTLA